MSTAGELTPTSRPVVAARLVGRARERELLQHAIVAAGRGDGRSVVVLGEAGIGKSRLAREAEALAAEHGFRALRGRAVETRTPVALRPLAEALCSGVRAFGLPDTPELQPFRGALGQLVPEWQAHEPDAGASLVALSEGILRFLRAIAGERGCLLVLEDLHWSDAETLHVLEYLADNLRTERVVCLATARLEEESPAVDLARALEARRSADVVMPARLTERELAEMVAACLGTDEITPDVVAFARRSDGVPFLVEELLAVAVASGSLVNVGDTWAVSAAAEPVVPFTFADGVRRRLRVLGDGPRAVVHAAAVLGRRFDWALLPAITGLEEGKVVAALHVAIDAQLVSIDADDGTFRFRHALSRDAVLAGLLPPERSTLSERALAALEHADNLSGDECELAAQLAQQAGDRAKAAELLVEVGRRALDRGALATAESTFERARVLSPTGSSVLVDVERCLTEVLAVAGKADRAAEIGASLLDRLRDDPASTAAQAEVHLQLARAAVVAARFGEVLEHLDQARAAAGAAGDGELLARIDVLAAQAAMGLDRTDDAAVLARRALDRSVPLGHHAVTCEALELQGRCDRPRDLAAAERAFSRAHAVATAHRLAVWEVRALHELGTIDLLAGRGTTRLDAAREAAWNSGALATAAVLDVQIAAALSLGDDLERSVAVARRGAELAGRHHLADTYAAARCFEALAHARLGARTEFDRCGRDAASATPGSRNVEMLCGLARAVLAFIEENRDDAISCLRAAATIQAGSAGDRASGPITGLWFLLATVEGHDDAAPDEPVHYVGRGSFRYACAVLAGRSGDRDQAIALAAEGDEHLRNAPWFRHHGRRLVAEAALTDGWSPPPAWLLETLAYFDGRGEERIASACRALLRRAGVAVPRRRGDQVVPPELRALGITGRELDVLRLLAEGFSNRDIARQLFLSPRTVERHLANMSAKTGVERRAQLVAFAARTLPPLIGG